MIAPRDLQFFNTSATRGRFRLSWNISLEFHAIYWRRLAVRCPNHVLGCQSDDDSSGGQGYIFRDEFIKLVGGHKLQSGPLD